jgi:hypothetical protein
MTGILLKRLTELQDTTPAATRDPDLPATTRISAALAAASIAVAGLAAM